MSDSGERPAFLSDIAYHDYVALLCFTDAEWTRNRPRLDDAKEDWSQFLKNERRFREVCEGLKGRIQCNHDLWHTANYGGKPPSEEGIDAYILDPISFISFGHADGLSVVLLDDFDAMHYLTSQLPFTMEEVVLAFCPTLESLGAMGKESVFCDLTELMPCTEGRQEEFAWKHPPLLVFSKLKMDTLATNGYALLFQQSLLKAIAKNVCGTLDTLYSQRKLPAVSGLIQDGDLDSVKCCLLDLQGSEEIGLLVFCENYSVGVSLIEGLRTITYRDVFKAEFNDPLTEEVGGLERLLDRSSVHRSLIRLTQGVSSDRIASLYPNHIFRWSHSTLGIAPAAFFEPAKIRCHGYAESLSEVQVMPGHRFEVERQLDTNKCEDFLNEIPKSGYHSFQIGTCDLLASPAGGARDSGVPLVPLKTVLSFAEENLRSFGCTQAGVAGEGRDAVDISTSFAIPIPRLGTRDADGVEGLYPEKADGHFSPLSTVLPSIQERLCGDGSTKDQSGESNRWCGRLSLTKLNDGLRRCGIPRSLRQTIRYLYQNFAIIVRDPFLFDLVLDLYDTFATLHALLTEHLPAELERTDQPHIDHGRVKQLSMMVAAVNDALAHRMLRAYPENPIREMGIDYRGGLNQILFAADVPVKCGLGMLRKYVYEQRLAQDPQADRVVSHRDSVGGLIQIDFEPGATCYPLAFGTESSARLAFFRVDVPHVMHVATFCDNFHEVFHLIFESIRDGNGPTGETLAVDEPRMAERVSEIFANLLVLIFVFGCDWDQFLCFQLCAFSKSLISVGKDGGDTVARCTEVLIRLFVVSDMVRKGRSNHSLRESLPAETRTLDELDKAFEAAIEEYGGFIDGFEAHWRGRNSKDVKLYCQRQFREILPRLAGHLPRIWREVYEVHKYFQKEGPFVSHRTELDDAVAVSFEEGRPLIRNLFPDAPSKLKPLLLVCTFLRLYAPRGKKLKDLKKRRMHIVRCGPERKVTFEAGNDEREWNDFLVDVGSASTFIPPPSGRRKRLLKEIATLKTLWNISSNMRGKRLWEILCDNWSKDELVDLSPR